MIASYFRKILCTLTALFWLDRRKILAGFVTTFWAVQHIACAYGTDEPCHDCPDHSLYCTPTFNKENFSRKDYSECELALADSMEYIRACETPCKNTERTFSPAEDGSVVIQKVCADQKPDDCSYDTRQNKKAFIDSLVTQCSLDHMKSDSSLTGYHCLSGENVSVEEGEKRQKALDEWLEKRENR